jgi:hypothetical protein
MRATTALLAIIAAVAINQVVCAQSCSGNGGESSSVVQYQLGDTICNITLYERAGDMNFVSFINLHANENTSVVAARSLIYLNGGRLVYLRHGNNSRLITFSLEGKEYTFDPNRMFTTVGVEKTLRDNGNYSDSASKAVQAFAAKVLEVYQFDKQYTVVSIHNNGPLYSAEAYLPNATFAEDAAEVFICPESNPHNFLFVTNKNHYDFYVKNGFNVVLQAGTNGTLTDDGSLSVYAAMQGKDYVNIEARATQGGDGIEVVNQLSLLLETAEMLELDLNSRDNAVVWAILVSLVAALMVAMGLFFFIRHRTSYFTLKNSYTEVTND